jgi:hypothetical protein
MLQGFVSLAQVHQFMNGEADNSIMDNEIEKSLP